MKSAHSENNPPSFDASPPDMLDPVVDEALARKLVTNKQIADAWLKRKTMYQKGKRHPVWRWLAEQAGVDREAIYAIAACQYDYKSLNASAEALKTFVQRISACFTDEQWKIMMRTGIIPVKRTSPRGISSMWDFAVNDPTLKSVHAVVQQLAGKQGYELFYADQKTIATLLAEVVLMKMEMGKPSGDVRRSSNRSGIVWRRLGSPDRSEDQI